MNKISDVCWEIPVSYKTGMRVPGRIFLDEKNLLKIRSDQSLEQVANVAFLPGIVKYSLAMPDIHWGYGFPIGGVAATDPEEDGVVSPGGVGYDINCGVRLLKNFGAWHFFFLGARCSGLFSYFPPSKLDPKDSIRSWLLVSPPGHPEIQAYSERDGAWKSKWFLHLPYASLCQGLRIRCKKNPL